jgi:hypothetical protein
MPPSTDLKIDVADLAARLPDDERLRIAKSLVAAAYVLCPKDRGGTHPDPASLELANFMLGGIDLLLETLREKRRSECWDAIRERQDRAAAHGLH